MNTTNKASTASSHHWNAPNNKNVLNVKSSMSEKEIMKNGMFGIKHNNYNINTTCSSTD